jgi:signal transduction histidine kinase/DNA-binding response OmpR family regulator
MNPDREFVPNPERKSWLLAVLLVLFILPLVAATYWMYFQSKQEIERAELQSDQLRARTLSAIVEQSFTSAENLLTSIADRDMLRVAWAHHDVVALKAHLEETRKLGPSFLFVSAYEPGGTMRAIVPADKIVGQNFAYRDWYRGVTSHWQPYVSEVYRTAAGSSPLVVAVAVPIRDERGAPIGILMATYSLSQLASEFSALEKGATGAFYVVDQHGVIAAAPGLDANAPPEPVRLSASGAVLRALTGEEGSGQFSIAGKNTFAGFAPITRLNWAVLYARSESDALAPAVRLRIRDRSVGLYLLLVYLATAALAALLMRRQTHLLAANQALNQELEKQSKFKDQFLSTMSHELRTPLNAVLGFSDLLADERYGSLNDRQRRYVSHIHTGGKHLLRLISDILDLSKIEAGRMELALENLTVETAFAEVLSVMHPLADKKSQKLVSKVEHGLCVRADATRFRQILMNLSGNAIKFTPEGGRIELAARLVEGRVKIEVRDNGNGIPLEDQQRIFEAFYRRAESGEAIEGTGLGLAITTRLVELHGSKLEIESKLGEGTCFYFSLPLLAIAPAKPAREIIAASKAVKTPRILIVEDNAATGQLIQSQLTSAGYESLRCDQPERATEMAAEQQPDAITLDLLMQPVHGLEVLLRLKNDPRTSKIPVIVVTIVDQPGIGTALGADEYLVKPVDKATLLAAVERCLTSHGGAAPARPILVVEDDASTREMIQELLTTGGYSVITAADGAQARARVATALPDLVILDLVLPKMSGLELLAEWRGNPRTADLPVFFLTSKDLTKEEEKYVRAHAESLFRKQHSWREPLMKQLERVVTSQILEDA